MTDSPVRIGMRKRLVNKILGTLDEYQEMPWDSATPTSIRPFNPASGVVYRGGNVTNLIVEQAQRGSDDPRWMTLKQANSAGYGIRAGSQGAIVEYWDFGPKIPEEDIADGEEPVKAPPRPFYAVVFNGRDIVGLPPFQHDHEPPEHLARRLIFNIESVGMNGNLFHMPVDGRLYDPIGNRLEGEIDMGLLKPYRVNLNANDLAMEFFVLAQWSGHSSRLNRINTDGFATFEDYRNSEARAKEDLRASIAVMLMKNMIGLKGTMRDQSERNVRIAEFLRNSKNGKDEVFRAARDAEKIVEYLFSFAPEIKAEVESRINTHRLVPRNPNKGAGMIADLPNFIPPGAVAKTGKDDPRWKQYVSDVGAWLKDAGHGEDLVNKTLIAIEPQFTQLMNAGLAKGKTIDDMHEIFKSQFAEKLQASRTQIDLWSKFCSDAQVINDRDNLFDENTLSSLLTTFGEQFKEVVSEGKADPSSFLFGDSDRLTGERLKDIHSQIEQDNDVILTPTKIHQEIASELGIMDEDIITGYQMSHDDDLDYMDSP